ncbi:MAG: type II 3-dehydroquinate dehydratase [Actinobacteria bacterium]|jgi:3-dehydroquinate dehydratase-2|uniref:3-dehydroquinate dehydratase n=1 Tax=freshwater metagenome TaxID=449393 RepID=A0A6J6J436_9ZZZZ|nr:type II 3-dehydroquinate dehydratase [Actinomycetota bacterium]MTA92297.1 type II 3-dehydroquinate dehydratase [Actinomycetota bacterium]
MQKVLVLNGPNLGRLGSRQPEIYGSLNFEQLSAEVTKTGVELGLECEIRQTDSESELIGWIHEATDAKKPVVLNPAAFTHYSYALRDAVAELTSSGVSLIEVHISNPHSREEFRQTSVISGVASGVIAGFGFNSYLLALRALSS